MSKIGYKESQLSAEILMIKNHLIKTYQFNLKGAFRAIDDWNAGWIDANNLKRFLQNMGYQAKKP